jgi:C4-dicarboxylate-specific signal transduction histidine kinase
MTCVADAELLAVALGYVMEVSLSRSETEPARIAVEELAGGGVAVTMTDSGGPVGSEQIERLLEPFAVCDVLPRPAPGEPRRERLGLGLSIAGRIFEAHGGHLRGVLATGGLALQCVVGVLPKS